MTNKTPITIDLHRLAAIAVFGFSLVTSSVAQQPASVSSPLRRETKQNETGTEAVVLPASISDPIEPFNRIVYGFNKGIMTGVMQPSAKVYRFIVFKPVRTGINNFGRNLTFSGRLANNLLQGKWTGARDETYRFCCNTTVGVAGLRDVATHWRIPKSDADFGETFGK